MNQAIQDYPDHIHVLMGDFNVSPWSIYFQQFDDQLDE
jgi:endonuclease/exonuclease/phosphatase family metal-dependent hydrolase